MSKEIEETKKQMIDLLSRATQAVLVTSDGQDLGVIAFGMNHLERTGLLELAKFVHQIDGYKQ